MFSKFKLKEIKYSDIEEYECIGQEYYENKKKDIQNSLREFIGLDGIIDGTKLQENWFPTKQKFDVFLSHSHNDEKLPICLAGFLKEKLDLDTFIDSCLWRYSNDLLKELDKKYCKYSDGVSYDYDKRNYSSSHVHMMLSIALSRMIDNCEAVFFLNSENSISLSVEIDRERTSSPWIYNELSMADIIQIREYEEYRKESYLEFAHRECETLYGGSGLHIQYKVNDILKKFIPLTYCDLINCAEEWEKSSEQFQSSLDYIYFSKGILALSQ